MHTIYLVRHGQKESHAGDPPLTEKGRDQALKTGLFLRQFPIESICSSPSRRTVQTAQIIALELHVPVTLDPRLKERMDFLGGDAESFTDFLKEWTYASWHRDVIPKNGDSSVAAGKRIENVVSDLYDEKERHLLFVTHGGVIADFLRNILGDRALESTITEFPIGRDHDIGECSISIVEINEKRFMLQKLAWSKHLEI